MKRLITYLFIIAALVFTASCINDRVFREDGDEGLVTLRLQTAEMATRVAITDADPVAGEGAENALTHADFFFFSDEEGTTLLDGGHVRLTVGTGGLEAKSGNIYEYTFDATEDGIYQMLKGTSYVYVLANYPTEIPADTNSLAKILNLPIALDSCENKGSFVMDSFDSATGEHLTYLKPSKAGDEKTYTIGLTRAAAKLLLDINVADSFTDEAQNVWTPMRSEMWVNFINARKTSTVKADTLAFDLKSNFFNTSQAAPDSVASAKTGFTTWKVSPVYTYPQRYQTSDVTAPYFKIFCPWRCEKKGPNNFYYKIILPKMTTFQRNKIYRLKVDLDVVGGTEDDWAQVVDSVYVADWWAPSVIESVFENALYLDVPVRTYTIYGIDSLVVPVVSSNMIQVIGTGTGTNPQVQGTKTNLYDGSSVTVNPTITSVTKDGFTLKHVLNTNITSPDFDCTPITYTMIVKHTEGGLTKEVPVTITQYPSIYAEADLSNGYAYVNSYANSNISGGRHHSQSSGFSSTYTNRSYNSRGNNADGSDELGSMNYLGDVTSQNNNNKQYVVNVSVLPEGYRVAGMTDDAVIGDPRVKGSLTYNYLGYYGNGANGTITRDVQSKYNGVADNTQNVIAPALRIASSWGATTTIRNVDRAEERCAAYQENGYPAGRWRLPTIAEIDFLIMLSTYEHIPALFTTNHDTKYTRSGGGFGGNYRYTASGDYYGGYWSNGPSIYVGVPYTEADHSTPFVLGTGSEVSTTYYTDPDPNNSNTRYSLSLLLINNEYFDVHVRCVYDEWYWGSNKYDSNGNEITGNGTAATQWIGYKF